MSMQTQGMAILPKEKPWNPPEVWC